MDISNVLDIILKKYRIWTLKLCCKGPNHSFFLFCSHILRWLSMELVHDIFFILWRLNYKKKCVMDISNVLDIILKKIQKAIGVRNPVAILCAPRILQNTIHVTMCVRTLFTSLLCHCARQNTVHVIIDHFFIAKNYQCTIHNTVHAILTTKIVSALFMTLWRQSGLLKLLVRWRPLDLSVATTL